MKKNTIFIDIIIITTFIVISCGNNKNNNIDINTENKSIKDTIMEIKDKIDNFNTPELINTQEYKEKIFDFSKNTQWKYKGDKPCIIDFYADWCGPCKMLAPILEELALEYEGRVHIYKVNVDKEQELSNAFNIQSIPSILFVPVKNQPRMVVGYISKDVFKQNIENFLLSDNDNVTK